MSPAVFDPTIPAPSNLAAVEPRLRPRGHWDWYFPSLQIVFMLDYNFVLIVRYNNF
jgi:hypothetical protein